MKTKPNLIKTFRLYWWALLAGVLLATATYLPLGLPPFLSTYAWTNMAFFAVISLAGLLWIFAGLYSQKNQFFLLAFFTVVLIDLMGGVIFFLVADRVFEVDALWFFAPFATYYLLFTIIKVLILVRLGDQMKGHEQGE